MRARLSGLQKVGKLLAVPRHRLARALPDARLIRKALRNSEFLRKTRSYVRSRAARKPVLACLAVLVVLSSLMIFRAPGAFATSAGPNSPSASSTAAGGGSTNWTGAANVYAQDAVYASATLASATVSYNLLATGYGFNLPTANTTVNGVQVAVWKYSPTVSNQTMQDSTVSLIVGGAVTGSNLATSTTWPTANASTTYGGSANLWGTSLTVAQVNASNFGVAVAATNVHTSGKSNSATAYVDYISVTVYYTVNSVFQQASYRLFANQDAVGGGGGGNFAAKVDYTTGANPNSVATADFNGDGKPDLAVANYSSNTASVLINNGDGTFAAKVDYMTGVNPYSVATADFSGDGKPDLVVANYGSNTVSVFINNGDGTFAAKVDYTTGVSPYSVATADFNGDGKPDLAVADGSAVSVLINNGDGTFAAKVDYAPSSSQYIATADFNGDGKPDLAVTNYGSNIVSVFINNGDGTFATAVNYAAGSQPGSVTSADFNSDGKPDLAVASSLNTVNILINNGNGTFAANVNYAVGSGTGSVAAADFNGDGKPDLVVANYSSNTASVLINNGDGTFAAKVDYMTGVNPYSVATADFSGDGKPDLVVANSNSNSVSIFMNIPSINVGSALAAQNTAATTPGDGQPFRLRLDVGASNADAAASGQNFKLQYAARGSDNLCDTSFSGETYADVTDTSTVGYYDNPVATNGQSIATNANDPSDGTNTTSNGGVITQSYQEKTTTTFTNPSVITSGKDGMWDFALTTNGTSGGVHYCLRLVSSTGSVLNGGYSAIPEIVTPPPTMSQAGYRWFNNATTGQTTFAKTWGGTNTDYGYSLVQTSDGGYAVTGETLSYGDTTNGDMFLAKYDASGTLSWSRTWGGTGIDDGSSLVQTSDGGYAVTGSTNSYGAGSYDIFLAKYDSSGNLSWSRTWGGTGTDEGNSLVQTSDGGYAVTGQTSSYGAGSDDMFLAKYDSTGTLSWSRTWGGASTDYSRSLVQTSDGGYAVTGYTASYGAGSNDMFLAKYDASGTLSWSRTWGGTGTDQGYSLVQTSDGGYAVTGQTTSYGAGSNNMFWPSTTVAARSAGPVPGVAAALLKVTHWCRPATAATPSPARPPATAPATTPCSWSSTIVPAPSAGTTSGATTMITAGPWYRPATAATR